MDPFVFPLPLILPPGISDIPPSIRARAQVCAQTPVFCAATCLHVHVFPQYPHVNFLGENILDFDAGSGDGGDGGSQGRVFPVGQVVRGEDGEDWGKGL